MALLWLSAQPPSAPEQAALGAWARANDVELSEPRDDAPQRAYDAALVEQAERWLEEARKAILTLDPRAETLLASIQELLYRHPELPQAAWLEAERRQLAADFIQSTTRDAVRSDETLAGAYALEGARAVAFDKAPGDSAKVSSEAARFALTVVDARSRDLVYVDGTPMQPSHRFLAGRHLLQTYRADLLVGATWVELGPQPGRVRVDPAPSCSRLDLIGTEDGARAPRPDGGVGCQSWLAARTSAPGGVSVARCQASTCGAWLRLSSLGEPADALAARNAERDGGTWIISPWVTWGAAFAGVLVVSTLVLWQTGAFDSRERPTEFVFTGPSAAAVTF